MTSPGHPVERVHYIVSMIVSLEYDYPKYPITV